MGIFDKIKTLSETQGYTIAELERMIGVSAGSISKWATSTPKSDSLYKVAKIFDVKMEYFLEEFSDINNEVRKQGIIYKLANDELELLNTYRKLDSRGKYKVQTIAYEEFDRVNSVEIKKKEELVS